MLQLLKYRVGQTGQERVAAKHQHRQPVGMGKRCRRQKIRSARTGACGAEHEPAAQPCFGIGRCGESHALFVLPTIQRQFVFVVGKRLSKTGHIAVAKYTKSAAANSMFFAIDFYILRGQKARDRLCRCQGDCAVCHVYSVLLVARAGSIFVSCIDHRRKTKIRGLQPVATSIH